ncbi:MAG: putative DNA-binding domain-containing protein [Pseudomonadota bacterium]
MAERRHFQDLQREFAAHIRDPIANPPPAGVEDRRMAIYRRLFFNNLRGLLAKTFPMLRRLHCDADWDALIRGFMRDYRSHTPLFLKIPAEFVDYLTTVRPATDGEPPWLTELAHYEWVELSLSVSTASDDRSSIDPAGDLALGVPVLSRLAWLVSYRFPVHRIGPQFRPDGDAADSTFLLLHRRADGEVRFIELNRVSARLVELLSTSESPQRGADLFDVITAELNHPSRDTVAAGGLETLTMLRREGAILGTRRIPH